jgi:hypothetical protein
MFWSDQFDIKIQGVGRPRPTDELILTGGTAQSERFIALFSRGGRLVAAVAFNQPAKLIALRMLIGKRGGIEEALKIAAP